MEKEILSVKETAAFLGIRRETVSFLLNSNKLPGSKIGRIWRIQRKDIYKYLEDNKPSKEQL